MLREVYGCLMFSLWSPLERGAAYGKTSLSALSQGIPWVTGGEPPPHPIAIWKWLPPRYPDRVNDAEGLLLDAERRARRTSPPPALGTHCYREPRIPLGCRFPRLAFHSLIHGINFNNKNLAGTASLPSKSSQWQNQGSPGRGLEGRLSAHLLPLSPRCKGNLWPSLRPSALDLTTATMVCMVPSSLLPGGILPSTHHLQSSSTQSSLEVHLLQTLRVICTPFMALRSFPREESKLLGIWHGQVLKETSEPSTFPMIHENHHFFVSGATSLLSSWSCQTTSQHSPLQKSLYIKAQREDIAHLAASMRKKKRNRSEKNTCLPTLNGHLSKLCH